MYDAVIGRWGGLDPMAETNLSFSPFNYCSNNAINRIDPDGAWDDSWLLNIATGELSWWNSQGGNEFQMIHVVSPASNGGLLHLGTSILEGCMSKYFLVVIVEDMPSQQGITGKIWFFFEVVTRDTSMIWMI